jgi:hypothetical protein
MDDLIGLDWGTSNTSSPGKPQAPIGTGNYFPVLRPTPPISGRSTPALQNSVNPSVKSATNPLIPSKSTTPANDSFASLLPFNAQQTTKNLSLQEQQNLLQKQQEKEEHERRQRFDVRFRAANNVPRIPPSNGRATPDRAPTAPKYTATGEYGGQKLSQAINRPFANIGKAPARSLKQQSSTDTDDLLAAFDADTPVDNSSNMPPVSSSIVNGSGSFSSSLKPNTFSNLGGLNNAEPDNDDDDPFGLGTGYASKTVKPAPSLADGDDDDILGLLGRPVSQLPQPQPESQGPSRTASTGPQSKFDHAVAELVDMGFPAERARVALEATESGFNVQAAVGWLLNQAHEEAKAKNSSKQSQGNNSGKNQESRTERPVDTGESLPTWLREQSRSSSTQRREDSRSPANGERDAAKYATEIGNNLFKTANSLWKTGAKKLNQAVSELNSDSDSSQPKWMRETRSGTAQVRKPRQGRTSIDGGHEDEEIRRGPPTKPQSSSTPHITDEALMLESGDARPPLRTRPIKPQSSRPEPKPIYSNDSSRDQSPVVSTRQALPSRSGFEQQPSIAQARSKLSRQAIEDEALQSYVSPSRRKKTTPKPPSPEPDLLYDATPPSTSPVPSQSQTLPKPQLKPRAPLPQKPTPPVPIRKVPPLSAIALQSSIAHRQSGTAAFKLGNYAQATNSYTSSLRDLPSTHPLTIILLSNRALSHLKTGDPKACISDADSALSLIGPSKGQGETIDVGGEDGTKAMSIYWGKAMTRKAEALEQLERWGDAAKAWKECVEAGVGGATSIQGRNRCEKALSSSSSTLAAVPARRPPPPKARKPPVTKTSALDDLSGRPSASTAEAVMRLRAANAEAERVDDEKFALADSIDERLGRWRKGKEGNLRALLGSLDTVLWEGAGWKKVGMGELIVPGKVKIAYMKGIAKVHPDKVSLMWAIFGGGEGNRYANWYAVTTGCHDRAGYDQWSGIQHVE